MGTLRIVVDRTRCTAIGVCESLAPERFEIDDDAELIIHNEVVTPDQQEAMRQAVIACPAMALSLVTTES